MEKTELRLELLKLTYTHGRESAEIVKRAGELERYVSGEESEAAPKQKLATEKKPTVVRKNGGGNPDPFS